MLQVITANRLGDGRAVFQARAGWSLDVDQSEVIETKEALEVALGRANADAAENRVVEPYAIDVERRGATLTPVRLRERIRVDGPTTGHSKDATAEKAA